MMGRAKFMDIRGKITSAKNETVEPFVNIVSNTTVSTAVQSPNVVFCRLSAGSPIFKSIPAKKLPIVDSEIKVSVVISTYNRLEFLKRTLYSYVNQTFSKNNFELVIVDDNSTEDIFGLCKFFSQQYDLKFNYILVDKNKGAIPPKSFCQALTNNIGFKRSRGSVIIITGPETLQKETNIEKSWVSANEGYCVYGDIYRSSSEFVDCISKDEEYKNMLFDDMFVLPGAKHIVSQLTGFWWYYVAVRKEHILAINGVDEQYMKGIAGEDDNFAFRMYEYGVPLVRHPAILGIHQDHSKEDKKDLHSVRDNTNIWTELRNHNITLLNSWHDKKTIIANKNIDWGTEKAIIKEEIF